MKRVAPVKLKYNSRTLWFDPDGVEEELSKGDAVVVSTARGLEMGQMADGVIEVDDERVKKLKSPLKPVERRATEEDLRTAEEMERLSAEALPVFKEMAAQTSEDMHPVAVEYLLDGDRAWWGAWATAARSCAASGWAASSAPCPSAWPRSRTSP